MEVERVQTLALQGLKELPAQFIRPEHERPLNSTAIQGVTVPIISFSQSREVLVEELYRACSEWGFFILTDTRLPLSLIERLKEVSKEFFGLPQEEKEAYASEASSGSLEGYGTRMIKNHDQKLEWLDYFFHLMAPPSRVNYNFWPENPPSYREVVELYSKEMMKIANDLLKLMSQGLGLEENVLRSCLGGDNIEYEMKINMYPPCPQPELALGVEPHTDMSALTILVQNDVPGLQIWKDGNWVAADFLPYGLYVQLGDQLEVLSNGKYKSVLHRSVVNKEKVRMSWAVFIAPPQEAVIGPLPELVHAENTPKFSTKTFSEYRYCKVNKLPQ